MTSQTDAGAHKSFVNARLPWIVAGAAAIVYLLTLNPWLSPKGLEVYARATHQKWFTDPFAPVYQLVTSPFRLLPETWVPAALNVFSAVCAAIALGLLARSVALLPQDRTHKQREREQSPFALLSLWTAWIPPLLAVMVCGLQITFWENATNSSSGIFDLVLFAYSVRCLLEYRINGSDSWLLRAALVYAVGMTDTWVLIALFPAFMAALVWIKGLGFFNLRFLARLLLCGMAGLLFYLYLPLLYWHSGGTFWEWLKLNVASEFQGVVMVYRYSPHPLQFLLVLTSLLPILIIGIRWKSHFGDSSQLGTALTTWIFHLTHALLLGVCIWAAFDTRFSLRDVQSRFFLLSQNRDRMLPLYYLGALTIGYLTGYFLLVFKPLPSRAYRNDLTLARILYRASISIVCVVLVLAPLGLIYKNATAIKFTNGPAWRQYAAALTENLPSQAVVLSDRADILLLAQAALARNGKASNFVFLETRSLKAPAYQRFLSAQHSGMWAGFRKDMYQDNFRIDDVIVTDLLRTLSGKLPLYYLHPSFGAYFETFYPVPHGLVYELQPFRTNTVSPPPMSDAVFAENEAFWKSHETTFQELLPFVAPPSSGAKPTFRRAWMQRMHIPFETNQTAAVLGSFYSHSLNTLGVLEQRLGRLDAAGAHFAAAQECSPGNAVAAANLDFNKKLRAGERVVAESPESFEQRFGNINGLQQKLNDNGLFDTTTGCLAQGIVFLKTKLTREGAEQFERVLSLEPDNPLALLWLARSYIIWETPQKALPLVAELNAHKDSWDDAGITPADVLRVELSADYVNKKTEEIRPRLEQLSTKNLLDAAAQTCINFRDFTNALIVIQKRLAMNPDDVTALLTDGFARLQLNDRGQAIQAIAPLTHALSLQPTNSEARFLRGAAYLQGAMIEDATLDYQTLEKTDPTKESAAEYALSQIELLKKNTNGALRHLELSLAKAPTNSLAAQVLTGKIKSLKGSSQ